MSAETPLTPFFRPRTVAIRPGVAMESLSGGAQALFGSLAALGMPLEVVSGYRDPARNARAGGAKGSQHLHGNAIDINIEKLSDDQRAKLLDAAISGGARGVGIYPGGRSLHLDVREAPTAWGANAQAPFSGVADPNAYPAWARGGIAKLFGSELPAQTQATAKAFAPPPRPIAPSPLSSATPANTDMSPPVENTTGAPMEQPNQYAMPAPTWGAADNEQLMMALALLDNAIPKGVQAKDIGSVMSPYLAMGAKREERQYQRGRDAKADARQAAQDERQGRIDRQNQGNWQASHDLQKQAAERAAAAEERAGARPLIQRFEDDAGNVTHKQWNQGTRSWDPLRDSSAAPAPAAQAPVVPPDVQGPPIPPEMAPQALQVRPPPPGVNRQAWYQAETKRLAEESNGPKWDDVSSLRKEVQGLPSYKNVAQAAPVYRSMLDAAGRNDRASDVNLIYGMAKLMDPGSVVRESEMTVATAIATLPDQLRNAVQSQITSTGRLSPDVRDGIMREAYSRMGAYQGMYDQDANIYRGIADRRRMNVEDVLPNFGEFKPYERKSDAATPAPAAAPTTPQGGPTRKVIGGKTYVRGKDGAWFEE